MASIFTKIIQGEIPCYKIAEDENHFAFLDIAPIVEGHCLVVPKKEVDKFFELEDKEYSSLLLFAKKVSEGMSRTFSNYDRIGMSVVGLEVPHAHIHLMPINSVADMTFSGDRPTISKEEMTEIAERISSNITL